MPVNKTCETIFINRFKVINQFKDEHKKRFNDVDDYVLNPYHVEALSLAI